MVAMICEKTGIEFEAATKRTKNHPTIMSIINDSYKDGWYQQCMETIKAGREQRWTTLEQFTNALREAGRDAKAAHDAAYDRRVDEERAAKDAKRQRYVTNNLLRSRGYEWKRFENDEEDQDFYGAPEYEYTLYSPDHRPVSVKEAMFELAFYEDAKFAHEWLAKRGIAEETPAIEAKRQQEAAKVQQSQSIEYTAEQIAYQQEAIPHFIDAGMTPEIAEREAKRLSLPHHSWEDHILLESVRLPNSDTAALVINSDLRYGLLVADEWNGIDEIIERYPEMHSQLAIYSERNRRVSNAR